MLGSTGQPFDLQFQFVDTNRFGFRSMIHFALHRILMDRRDQLLGNTSVAYLNHANRKRKKQKRTWRSISVFSLPIQTNCNDIKEDQKRWRTPKLAICDPVKSLSRPSSRRIRTRSATLQTGPSSTTPGLETRLEAAIRWWTGLPWKLDRAAMLAAAERGNGLGCCCWLISNWRRSSSRSTRSASKMVRVWFKSWTRRPTWTCSCRVSVSLPVNGWAVEFASSLAAWLVAVRNWSRFSPAWTALASRSSSPAWFASPAGSAPSSSRWKRNVEWL